MFNGKCIFYIVFLIATFMLMIGIGGKIIVIAEAQTRSAEKPLTNEDIISLVKTGLSDSVIVSMIQKSATQFNLSPDALIKLRKVGVNNTVIESMIGGSGSPTGSAKTPLIPSAYGYYVIDENQLIGLKPTPVVTKIGIRPGGPRSGNPGIAMDGFTEEPSISIKSKLPIFIVYQQNIDASDFRLSDLVYAGTKQAYQFNYFGTGQAFFRGVYFADYYDTIQINLWRPRKEIRLRIEPVEGKSGMFRLIPESSLGPGKYTLYFKDAIHPDGTIFVAKHEQQGSAFYFKIEQ